MHTSEYLDKLEKIIRDINMKLSNTGSGESGHDLNPVKEILKLFFSIFLDIIKAPLIIVTRFVKNEFIKSMKKDAQLYAVVMGLMGVLFVFFSVLWLFVSVAAGIYFYDIGYSVFISVIFSIVFQFVSFIFIALIIYILSRKIKSLKMMKSLSKL